MSAPNSSDRFRELQAFVEGLNNFECSDSGSDDGFVFTAVTTQQARDFISGKSKGDIGKGEVMGKGDQSKGSGKGDMGKGDMGDSDKDSDKSRSKSEDDDDDDKPKPELYVISTPTPSTIEEEYFTEESLWKMTNVQLRGMLSGKKGVSKFRKEQLVELVIASKSKTTDSD